MRTTNRSNDRKSTFSALISSELSPMLESLEPRLLLSSAPAFATTLPSSIVIPTNSSYQLGVSATDADGGNVTITATSDNPTYTATVPTGDKFVRLYFNDYQGHSLGSIVVELFSSNTYAAAAVQRFIDLSSTVKINDAGALDPTGHIFYTNVPVHRIMKGFMFQSGDAVNKNGSGDSPLPNLADSFDPTLDFSGPGVLAMANTGQPDSSNCQWFLTDGAASWLNQKYILFGQMISGQSTYDAIINQPMQTNPQTGQATDAPVHPPILDHVSVLSASDVTAEESGTVILRSTSNFHGVAHVTITLNDGTHTVSKTITVCSDQVLPGTSNASAEYRDGNKMYVTTITSTGSSYAYGLSIYDVTNLNSPSLLGQVTLPSQPLSVKVYKNMAYVADADAGVVVYDVTNPSSIVKKTTLTQASTAALETAIQGNTLFVADYGIATTPKGMLAAYNISNPSNITLLGTFSQASSQLGIKTAVDVSIDGNYAYVSDSSGKVFVINVSNPAAMTCVASIAPTGYPWGLDTHGNYLYVANQGKRQNDGSVSGGQLEVYNISNPAAPVGLGTLAFTTPGFVRVQNQNAIVGYDGGAALVNVANPAAMTTKLDMKLGSMQAVALNGTDAIMVMNGGGIGITDVSSLLNHAPVLDANGLMSLDPIAANATTNSGTLVSAIIASAGGDRITDADSGAKEGLAVVATDTTKGSWQYSLNGGATWTTFKGYFTGARLLASDANTRIRFVPNAGITGLISAGITFRAWDQTDGVNGGSLDTTLNGGVSAFSVVTETAGIAVGVTNHAPVLDNTGTMNLAAIAENATTNSGTLISAIIASAGGNRITDADAGAVEGIAVVATNNTNGSWQYSLNGTTWTTFTGYYTGARLLAADATTRIRFVPKAGYVGAVSPAITFRAWDMTSGVDGGTINAMTYGGSTSLSVATETAGITVKTPNQAPVLDNTGTMSLAAIATSDTNNNGTLVSDLLASAGGNRITDADAGAVEGIAVVATNNTNGKWQYSINGGSTWITFTGYYTGARLLAADANTYIRFVPNTGYTGSVDPGITFRAWDQTEGANGGTINSLTNGGLTSLSVATETASISVTA